MNDEQKEARRISAESGNIKWIKDHCLRTKDGDDDYVFISYKSDDYKIVLDDIVYNTCRKYGLRVYFDTAFDDNVGSWIEQFYDNMCSTKCKAMIAFIDDAYYSSYATLMEMMARKTRAAGGDMELDTLFFLPINIGEVTDILSDDNTGLGTERFSNNIINRQAGKELSLFNELFEEVADDDPELKFIYKRRNQKSLYREETDSSPEQGKMYLNITACRKLMKRVCPEDNGNDGKNKSFVEVIHDKLVNSGRGSVFGEIVPENAVDAPGSSVEGYAYTIFGKEYKADSREQGKLMYDVFVALMEKYPEKAEVLTQHTCVARAENVENANTKQAKPPYFRACRKFTIGGSEYYVGTSYGFNAKLAEIKRMFETCGADVSQFDLNGKSFKAKGKKECTRDISEKEAAGKDCFKYILWNEIYASKKLADMMHNVFDIVSEKYPEKINGIAQDNNITAVALKSDVDECKLSPNKQNYFLAKKEHVVNGTIYYVSTRYNREQGIRQLERIIKFCEGTSDAFKIIHIPDKSKHAGNGKKGIEELL